MNAYELADYLDNNVEAMLFTEQPHLDIASTMLRQQAKRIEELEKCMVKSSGLLFNYKYELELERAMSAQLREELEKYK
jgi:uridylate kinase